MSFSLYWCAVPTPPKEELHSGYDLKWILAKHYGDYDGSMREMLGVFTEDAIPFLEGVVAATASVEVRGEAEELIRTIRANPNGVQVWIGEPDDA